MGVGGPRGVLKGMTQISLSAGGRTDVCLTAGTDQGTGWGACCLPPLMDHMESNRWFFKVKHTFGVCAVDY